LAKARGITLAAARRMTLRHKWPKQVGNDGLTRVSVPASALGRVERAGTGDPPGIDTGKETNGALTLMSAPALVLVQPQYDGTGNGSGAIPQDAPSDLRHAGNGAAPGNGNGDVAAAVRSLGDAVASLSAQLLREQERADRAENRAAEAETRNKELQEQLQIEMIEHRRVVGHLAEQLSARRSWWPWWRR
jgi:hypothetical protein